MVAKRSGGVLFRAPSARRTPAQPPTPAALSPERVTPPASFAAQLSTRQAPALRPLPRDRARELGPRWPPRRVPRRSGRSPRRLAPGKPSGRREGVSGPAHLPQRTLDRALLAQQQTRVRGGAPRALRGRGGHQREVLRRWPFGARECGDDPEHERGAEQERESCHERPSHREVPVAAPTTRGLFPLWPCEEPTPPKTEQAGVANSCVRRPLASPQRVRKARSLRVSAARCYRDVIDTRAPCGYSWALLR